ncbi:hypothetical protein BWI97_07205 [Siphonobacter sp. BAB-5405]|uniref:DUF6712 family protein n=1 Tax=Siphonobacter sp. BAB-5405 TaxID=1864825 RepID=UPI000C80A5B9|nr:DUF6712 family protein [Siphonobacter sp. BAB-5405]PMD97410.1 hypothetical protein BWI97_07205 [Siphonobacter sp. BAB-5405]
MPLINSTEILKLHVPGFSKDSNFKQMLLWVQKAERTYLLPKIGRELYAALEDYKGDAYDVLREMAERTVAWYAYYLALPYLDISAGDLGLKTQISDNSDQLPKWKYIELLRTTADTADQEMEDLLYFLFDNAEAFPEWLNSTTYKACNEYFFRTARQLTMFLPLTQNRYRTYTALQPYMALCERELSEVLTSTLLNELKAKWQQPMYMGWLYQEQELLDLCREYIAPQAMLMALPDLKFKLYPDGLKISTYEDAFAQQPSGSQERISQQQQAKLTSDAAAAMARIKTYLERSASATVFPSYYERKLASPQRTPLFLTNDHKKSFIL